MKAGPGAPTHDRRGVARADGGGFSAGVFAATFIKF
jgi:hypothetical protein